MGSIAVPSDHEVQQKGRRVYLLTSPRTASNLFVKMLNIYQQPKAVVNDFHGGYFFMPGHFQRNEFDEWDVPVDQIPEDHRQTLSDIHQDSMTKYVSLLKNNEQSDKIVFVKEHIFLLTKPSVVNEYIHGASTDETEEPWSTPFDKDTDVFTPANKTIIPDNVLNTFQPTILIRHPALQMPSLWRFQQESHGKPMHNTSQKMVRKALYTLAPVVALYDYYASYFQTQNQGSPWPLVIDSTDLITHPATVMQHFCHLTGLDFEHCSFNWDKASKENLQAQETDMVRRALSTLNASTGVVASKAPKEVDIDAEVEKWKKEFGDEVAAELEHYVRAEIPNYEYLKSKRWDPVGKDDEVAAEVTA